MGVGARAADLAAGDRARLRRRLRRLRPRHRRLLDAEGRARGRDVEDLPISAVTSFDPETERPEQERAPGGDGQRRRRRHRDRLDDRGLQRKPTSAGSPGSASCWSSREPARVSAVNLTADAGHERRDLHGRHRRRRPSPRGAAGAPATTSARPATVAVRTATPARYVLGVVHPMLRLRVRRTGPLRGPDRRGLRPWHPGLIAARRRPRPRRRRRRPRRARRPAGPPRRPDPRRVPAHLRSRRRRSTPPRTR